MSSFFAQVLSTNTSLPIRYVALGDSYTVCEGATNAESWPLLLAKHLTGAGIKTELVANPSRTGWTTEDLIQNELEVLKKSNADFVTLCIGVNDWVQGIDTLGFHEKLVVILDYIQKHVSNKANVVLLTIPDFSVTPTGAQYSHGRNISKGLSEFNNIIMAEAKKRRLKTVDLFLLSKGMMEDSSLIAEDGLHPSAKEYALWEKAIFPIAKNVLKK